MEQREMREKVERQPFCPKCGSKIRTWNSGIATYDAWVKKGKPCGWRGNYPTYKEVESK